MKLEWPPTLEVLLKAWIFWVMKAESLDVFTLDTEESKLVVDSGCRVSFYLRVTITDSSLRASAFRDMPIEASYRGLGF